MFVLLVRVGSFAADGEGRGGEWGGNGEKGLGHWGFGCVLY